MCMSALGDRIKMGVDELHAAAWYFISLSLSIHFFRLYICSSWIYLDICLVYFRCSFSIFEYIFVVVVYISLTAFT